MLKTNVCCPMKLRLGGLFILVAFLLSSCANLEAVGDFARMSATTADYQSVVNDYIDSPKRQKSYESERSAAQIDQIIELRNQQKPQLEGVQSVLVEYMSALGALADGKLPNVDDQINAISSSLEKGGYVNDTKGIKKETASAAASIANILVRATLDHWRQRQLEEIIKECDPHVQSVIAGLKELLDRDLRASLDNEELALSKPFRAWNASAISRNDPDGAGRVALIFMNERREELKLKRARLDAYIKVLDTIGKGHADLSANVDHITGKSLTDRLKGYGKDLLVIQSAIRKLVK
ncbi:MAG: hypothetical protein FDX18_10415 [Chlorobium sp.]|nr:MAG: hypothetical protein FDX18_10415 [Chlorobium sp.]